MHRMHRAMGTSKMTGPGATVPGTTKVDGEEFYKDLHRNFLYIFHMLHRQACHRRHKPYQSARRCRLRARECM